MEEQWVDYDSESDSAAEDIDEASNGGANGVDSDEANDAGEEERSDYWSSEDTSDDDNMSDDEGTNDDVDMSDDEEESRVEEEWVEYDGSARPRSQYPNASQIRLAPGVTVIPESAFWGCGLRVVDLRDVTTISDYAFDGCHSLERVIWTTAASIEIGRGAFHECWSLGEIDLSNATTIGESAFLECMALERVSIPSSVAEVGASAFKGCEKVTDVEVGEGTQRIGKEAFMDCKALRRISIPPSVTDIGDLAFDGCNNLVEVGLSEGLRHIGSHAFSHCGSLERVTIRSSTTTVGIEAFENCTSLAEVTLPEGVHCIEDGSFHRCTALAHVNIPPVALVIDIGGSSCQLLKTAMPVMRGRKVVVSKWVKYTSIVPDSLVRLHLLNQIEEIEAKVNEILGRPQLTDEGKIQCIGESFAYCGLLDEATRLEMLQTMEEEWVEYDGGVVQDRHRNASRIRLAPGVTVIPRGAFGHDEFFGHQVFEEICPNLRAVDLRDVTTISDNAFNSCHSLERVIWTTDASIEIGRGAFYRCWRLMEIDLRNVTTIGENAFADCLQSLRCVNLSSVIELGEMAFLNCESLAEVEFGEEIQRIGKDVFMHCTSLVRISIPPCVTDIETNAFSGCKNLVEVELNEGLRKIGSTAFSDCTSLTDISIPSTTVEIGFYAFTRCHHLKHAELQEGLQIIGSGSFRSCHSLERVIIPSSTTYIGRSAFQTSAQIQKQRLWPQADVFEARASRLSEVTLREGILAIDSEAFIDCTVLEHINIPPIALVVDFGSSSCQFMRTTMPATPGTKLVVSKWLQHRSPGQLERVEAKVNEILGHQQLPIYEKDQCIRHWFAYHDLLDVTTMLELAIWRCNVDGNVQDPDARKASRQNCGGDMNVIIPGVLQYLEGNASARAFPLTLANPTGRPRPPSN